MTVSVRVARDLPNDRRWISGVYRDYLAQLSPASTGLYPALSEFGHPVQEQLARTFSDPVLTVLTVVNDSLAAGFAVVRDHRQQSAEEFDYSLAEFYVAPEWRRRGVGRAATRLIFDRFAGRWHVSEALRNQIAVRFWKQVLQEYCTELSREHRSAGEVHHYFDSARAATRDRKY